MSRELRFLINIKLVSVQVLSWRQTIILAYDSSLRLCRKSDAQILNSRLGHYNGGVLCFQNNKNILNYTTTFRKKSWWWFCFFTYFNIFFSFTTKYQLDSLIPMGSIDSKELLFFKQLMASIFFSCTKLMRNILLISSIDTNFSISYSHFRK